MKTFFLFLLFAVSAQAQDVFTPAVRIPKQISKPLIETYWTSYDGPHSPDWPRDSKPAIRPGFVIPVLIGQFPDREYKIIGHIYVYYPPKPIQNQRDEAMRAAALDAKKHGADAFLLREAAPHAKHWYAAGTAVKWVKR